MKAKHKRTLTSIFTDHILIKLRFDTVLKMLENFLNYLEKHHESNEI